MKRLVLLVVSLLVICGLVTVTRAAEEEPVQTDTVSLLLPLQLDLLLWFPDNVGAPPPQDNDILGRPAPAPRTQPVFTLKTVTRAQQSESHIHLLDDEMWNVFWNVTTISALADIKLTNEGEVLSDPLDPVTRVGTVAGQYYLFRLEYDPVWMGGTYGTEYRFVGKDFQGLITTDVTSDQEGVTLWGKWRLGVVQMRTSLAEWWDNVDDDPNQPRMTTVQGEVALDIDLPALPRVGLTYARSATESSDRQNPQRYWQDTLGVTLYYNRSLWQATLASMYATTTDRYQSDSGSITFHNEFSVLYHPIAAFTITPTVRYGTTWYRPSEAQTNTSAASLSLTYLRISEALNITLYGGYEKTKSSDGYVHIRTLDTAATFGWDLGMSPLGEVSLSFKVVYSNYFDYVYDTTSSSDVFGEMRLRLAFS